ncbi:hypothetical protein IW261DRAFT_1558191 [Armillaria novae-zelandiae]|uniref:Uncharacterized protein n=1 Tax=Armillaria novae-zelandiae TaxID=153914 RepID=A0AA39PNN3_9AGAR|nr:hypothetical protein IW261DRAFT_1558191 [Armillaria novae-zelandiae]
MSSTNNSIPTLNSLVAQADALMKSPPVADADFLAITTFFNEAVTIKEEVKGMHAVDSAECMGLGEAISNVTLGSKPKEGLQMESMGL